MHLNLKRSGEGDEKIVAIHGLGSAATAWDLVKPHFEKNFEFITLDLPGHGNSKLEANLQMAPSHLADLIIKELVKNGIETFHLVGNSLGGWIALEMAARYPDRVLSITGVAPAGLWLVPSKTRIPKYAISRYMARATYRFAYPIARIEYMRYIGFRYVSPQWEKFSIETCAEAAIAMGSATGYYTLWDAFLGNRFDSEISEDIPVTIIFGDTDLTLPVENCQERSLVPKHSDWIVLPNSGHAPMWDQVDAVISETIKTINKTRKP